MLLIVCIGLYNFLLLRNAGSQVYDKGYLDSRCRCFDVICTSVQFGLQVSASKLLCKFVMSSKVAHGIPSTLAGARMNTCA